MSKLTLISLMLFSQLGTLAIAQDTKPITDAESVIAIYTNDSGLDASQGPQLLVGIWGDGTVIWSNEHVKGGPPYFTAQVNPEEVTATFKKLVDVGAFDVPRLKQANFGPDSKFTTILVRTAGKELKMDSWHELYESNGHGVATEHGLTGLDGRKLLPALTEQSADYLHYRMTWLELRLAASNLIPKSGKKIDGVPTMLRGKLSWKPKRDKTDR
jgi:hypothetical protein